MSLHEDEKRRLRNIKKVLANQDPEDSNFVVTNGTVEWLVMKVEQAHNQIERLQERLFVTDDDKELLERAKKRLMASYRLTEEKAYKFIRDTSMNQRVSRIELAKRILDAKDL